MSSIVDNQRVALITGGNRGLGRATALQVAADGTDVIITYRVHKDEADEVVEQIRAQGRRAEVLQLDTSDVAGFAEFATSVRRLLAATWGRDSFDFLVNNAGGAALAPFLDTSEEAFDELVGVHFKGVFFLTQALAPLLADGGRIVNVSSQLTRTSFPGMAAYGAAKGAVEVLTRYLAQELSHRRITANVVAPGATATYFAGGYVGSPEGRAAIGEMTALGRVGEAEDIGGVIAALLAPRTGWITGQRIEASGGVQL